MNLNFFGIRNMIRFSRKIPKKYKKELLNRLVKDDAIIPWNTDEIKKLKNLFYLGMFYRAYDIFLTSIFAFMNNNEISLNLLSRAQLENVFLTTYLLKNPKEIRYVFKKIYEPRVTRSSMSDRDWFNEFYRDLSQKVHSFPEGLKSCFMNVYMLSVEKRKFVPILCLKHHNVEVADEEKEIVMKAIINTFDVTINNLKKIIQACPNFKVKSFSEIFRKGP